MEHELIKSAHIRPSCPYKRHAWLSNKYQSRLFYTAVNFNVKRECAGKLLGCWLLHLKSEDRILGFKLKLVKITRIWIKRFRNSYSSRRISSSSAYYPVWTLASVGLVLLNSNSLRKAWAQVSWPITAHCRNQSFTLLIASASPSILFNSEFVHVIQSSSIVKRP